MALTLANLAIPSVKGLPLTVTPTARRKIQALLLGFPGVSRRSPWAVARYLGHTGIDQARVTYLHFLWDWADSLIWPTDEQPPTSAVPRGIWNLDELPRLEISEGSSITPSTYSYIPTCVDVLKFLRLLARGYDWSEVADRMLIPPTLAKSWGDFVDAADRRLSLHGEPLVPETRQSVRFLTHVSESAWGRLLGFAHQRVINNEDLGPQSLVVARVPLRRDDIMKMIGASRQWLMWADGQFRVTRTIADYWSIEKGRQLVVATDKAFIQRTFDSIASEMGFTISSQARSGKKKKLQIDVAYEKLESTSGHAKVNERCAFILQDAAEGTVRSSFEWLTAATAWLLTASFRGESAAQPGNKDVEQLERKLAALQLELEQARQTMRQPTRGSG